MQPVSYRIVFIFILFYFSSSAGLVKMKLQSSPHFHVPISCRVVNLTLPHSSRCNISTGCCCYWRLGTLTNNVSRFEPSVGRARGGVWGWCGSKHHQHHGAASKPYAGRSYVYASQNTRHRQRIYSGGSGTGRRSHPRHQLAEPFVNKNQSGGGGWGGQ